MYDTSNIDGLTEKEAEIKGERLYYRSEKIETEIEDGDNLRSYDLKLHYNNFEVEANRVRSLETEWMDSWKWMRFKDEDEETVFTIAIGFGEKGEKDTTIVIQNNSASYRIRHVDYDTAMGLQLQDLVELQDRERIEDE